MIGTSIGMLRAELIDTRAAIAQEKRRKSPNLGTVHRLERLARKLEDKVEKWAEEQREAATRRRMASDRNRAKKARAVLEAPENVAARVARLAAKTQRERERREGKEKPRTALKRSGPIKPNPTRAAKRLEAQFSIKDGYKKYIKSLPCIRCGVPGPSDPMHILGVDLGGKAEHMLPGCRLCHDWQETHKLAFNEEFERKHGMTALEMALAMRMAYLVEKGLQET